MHSPEYYDAILTSIARPERRLFLNVNNERGIHIDALSVVVSEHRREPITADLFSSPFPLDKEDAMGFFREGTFPYPYLQQTFGSAIVEIRAIQHVKILLDDSNKTPSSFLTNPSYLKCDVRVRLQSIK